MGDRCWSSNCDCEFAIEFGSGIEIHFYPSKDGGALAVSQNTGIVGSASLSSREWRLAQEYVVDANGHTDFFTNLRERVLSDDDPKELFDDAEFESLLIPDFSIINCELAEYLSKHPEELQQLHWRKFEELLEAVFRNQGYQTELGPGRADQGFDLRLIRKDSIGSVVTLVQAKRYGHDNPIRLEIVQALSAVVDDQKANRGIVVTTSRFLPSAKKFAKRQEQRISLADSKDVAKWCELAVKRWK